MAMVKENSSSRRFSREGSGTAIGSGAIAGTTTTPAALAAPTALLLWRAGSVSAKGSRDCAGADAGVDIDCPRRAR
jgi:hypothetical protein